MKPYRLILFIQILFCFVSCAQDKHTDASITYSHEVVVSDLTIPWGFEFLPDQSMLISEKQGDLIHFKNGIKTKVNGLPEIKIIGQGGLLDIKLHPNYTTNGWIYFSYASGDGTGAGANTAIMRCKLENNSLRGGSKICAIKIPYKTSEIVFPVSVVQIK